MPELPEVETVRRGLSPVMEGNQVLALQVNRPDLRFPFPKEFAARVAGTRINRLGRYAKFLTVDLATGETLIMHLGMSGRFRIEGGKLGEFHHETADNPAHDHVVFRMKGGVTVTYNDPRRFGFMEMWPTSDFENYSRIKDMGPEPLSNGFSAAYLNKALEGKAAPIKAALLDQKVVAGLGNIYVCEALFRAGISPRRKSSSIPGVRAERLASEINAVIAEAIDAGGSSISDFSNASGELGYFQHRFRVYDREGEACVTCGATVKRLVQSGRSTFYCGVCQK